ncbi:hypothetical protein E1A91_A05G422700v1 [Gossypium mustelinum]|uniref:Uncharacterized protein n=2 Tax=Gossypium TaxID=3633 RepID=A0A5J5W0N4_GOSBA|nr:hypothetical protein ES319_A05G409400v1 [Gossypium barbadense]TYJ38130.1 hypothetical protein E1A91_A05G422700v1 [Gossypium mustelinum]
MLNELEAFENDRASSEYCSIKYSRFLLNIIDKDDIRYNNFKYENLCFHSFYYIYLARNKMCKYWIV